jgi:Cu-Zn family superoxide dismutase
MKNFIQITLLSMTICAACAHKEKMPEAATTAPVTVDPTASMERTVFVAQSVLKPGKNQKIRGILHFTQTGDKLKITGILENLSPGKHGIHIHDRGDCSAADFTSAGGHFNPGGSTHGSMDMAEHHAGDLGNINADRKGKAKVSVEVKGLALSGDTNIVGRSLIVHASADDFKSQPAGNSGERVACGVIEANQ